MQGTSTQVQPYSAVFRARSFRWTSSNSYLSSPSAYSYCFSSALTERPSNSPITQGGVTILPVWPPWLLSLWIWPQNRRPGPTVSIGRSCGTSLPLAGSGSHGSHSCPSLHTSRTLRGSTQTLYNIGALTSACFCSSWATFAANAYP